MANEPTGLFASLSRLIWSLLALSIALWCSVQLLLQIWIYLAVIVTLTVVIFATLAFIRWRRWGP